MFSIVHEVPTCVCRTRIGPSAPGPTPGHPGAVYVGSCSYVNYAKFIPIPPRTMTRFQQFRSRKTETRNSNCNSKLASDYSVLYRYRAHCAQLYRTRPFGWPTGAGALSSCYRAVHGPYTDHAVLCVAAGGRRAGVASSRPLDKASLDTLLTHYAPISPLKA